MPCCFGMSEGWRLSAGPLNAALYAAACRTADPLYAAAFTEAEALSAGLPEGGAV
jgi:hypothetical protein